MNEINNKSFQLNGYHFEFSKSLDVYILTINRLRKFYIETFAIEFETFEQFSMFLRFLEDVYCYILQLEIDEYNKKLKESEKNENNKKD
jgi:hypothetical protein